MYVGSPKLGRPPQAWPQGTELQTSRSEQCGHVEYTAVSKLCISLLLVYGPGNINIS